MIAIVACWRGALCVAACALQLAAPPAAARAQSIAITHVTVIDGTDATPRRDRTVVVRADTWWDAWRQYFF